MFSVRAFRIVFLAGLAVATSAAQSTKPHSGAPAELRSWGVTPGEFGPVLEIVSTRPLTPQIQVVENPLRLVVDLPGSTAGSVRTRFPFRNDQIKRIRLSQFQTTPPVSRIVFDLTAPVLYAWDATGNRLHIRIRADQGAGAKPQSVTAFTAGVQPAAVPVAVGTSGTLVEAGSRVASGASITAGEEIAILRLTRGGEVRVCPGTTVSVATSANGQDMMLGMSTGAMETHYAAQESVDSVLTPDFRVVLPGPGEFNLAISSDAKGNTCVGSMPGSTSSAVVAELLGSGTYELKPDQQVLFRGGRLDSVETPLASCGCPTASVPVMRTSDDKPPVTSESEVGENLKMADSNGPNAADAKPGTLPDSNSPKPVEGDKAAVESPLVFSGAEIAKARQQKLAAAKIPAAPNARAANLPLAQPRQDPLPAEVVLPPVPDPKTKGFFGKVKGFFGAIFH